MAHVVINYIIFIIWKHIKGMRKNVCQEILKNELWEVPLGKCFFESLHGFKVFDVIGKYSGNVLIMHGDRDIIVPVEYSKRAQELYQNSHLEIFPGEGHGFSAVGNNLVTQMLMNFIGSAGSIK